MNHFIFATLVFFPSLSFAQLGVEEDHRPVRVPPTAQNTGTSGGGTAIRTIPISENVQSVLKNWVNGRSSLLSGNSFENAKRIVDGSVGAYILPDLNQALVNIVERGADKPTTFVIKNLGYKEWPAKSTINQNDLVTKILQQFDAERTSPGSTKSAGTTNVNPSSVRRSRDEDSSLYLPTGTASNKKTFNGSSSPEGTPTTPTSVPERKNTKFISPRDRGDRANGEGNENTSAVENTGTSEDGKARFSRSSREAVANTDGPGVNFNSKEVAPDFNETTRAGRRFDAPSQPPSSRGAQEKPFKIDQRDGGV